MCSDPEEEEEEEDAPKLPSAAVDTPTPRKHGGADADADADTPTMSLELLDARALTTPRPKRRRASPTRTGIPVTPLTDTSHEFWWWLAFIMEGPLGILLRLVTHVLRAWQVFSGCTGQFSEAWAYQARETL